ncbi:ABC transporter permease [Denitrobaculum tricleocarpae]|uniref:ABC transporter permease n=2 Tax=Denitrobaculum tricleocarpae TaxID=2591009 RepID=A0A545SY12_9PROT|nr:ABC transporter permease [Denitrobaculum tricleocarpae]
MEDDASGTERGFSLKLLPPAYASVMLGLFFLVPLGIMLAVSFFHRVEGAFYEPSFELTNYARFLDAFFIRILAFSIGLSISAAVIAVLIAFPFTYSLTRARRGTQIFALVFLLAVLSLSEVIIGFSWSTLLSRTAGVSNLFVAVGLFERSAAYYPSLPALLLGLVYLSFPYTVLVLYPALSRLDPELSEAARMMGASPVRTFFTVVVPVMKRTIISTIILAFVFTLGAYILPQTLGKPPHWTLSVHITDQAIFEANLPFAAAMAILLLLVSLVMVAITLLMGKEDAAGGKA